MASELNILVVDDDEDNAMSLGEVFELEGHRVRTVFSGQDAIDACINSQFDLAFIDVMMPGKNGVESFLEIRRVRPQARVYMMTGYSVEELLQQAVRQGATSRSLSTPAKCCGSQNPWGAADWLLQCRRDHSMPRAMP
jgi:CheY-like chemotaxis protein